MGGRQPELYAYFIYGKEHVTHDRPTRQRFVFYAVRDPLWRFTTTLLFLSCFRKVLDVLTKKLYPTDRNGSRSPRPRRPSLGKIAEPFQPKHATRLGLRTVT